MEKSRKKEKRSLFGRFLNGVERVGNRLPHPITLFAVFTLAIILISALCAWLGVSATGEVIDSQTMELTEQTVTAVSLLNRDGIVYMLTSMVKNFTSFAPLGVVLVTMLGVGCAEGSGYLSAVLKKLVHVTPRFIVTPMLVFLGVMSNVATDIGYVLLIPIGALVFMASCACSVFCDGLRYVTKNLGEYGVTVFVGVPLIVENMYKKICRQIEKEGKQGKIQTGLKLAKFAEIFGLPVRRKIFKQVIDGLGGRLRLIICGAAPLTPETSAGMNGFGIATIQGYGLTETSPVLAAERPEDIAAGSVGKPMPSVNIQLFGEDENGIGEIVARGPNIMLGYLNQQDETAEAIKDGWFYTGDLGRFDKHGNLYITGRKKNVIVMKNGKNIFPEEIEEKLSRLPYVAECLVFSREKHNDLVLWAKIVYQEDYLKEKQWNVDQLAEQVRRDLGAINEAMPKYKHVNHFILTDEPMIKTTTQKVKRIPEIEKINAQQDSELCYNCTM